MPEVVPLTDILSCFVAETPAADVPTETIEPAKNVILDTIGVALAAVDRSIGKMICDHVAASGGAPATATVLGSGIKASPEMAALANGTLANALDFDDGSHLSTHVLPAALAVAEHHRLPGKAVLDAFIVAYEASARLTQVIDAKRRQQRGPTHRGWWHVGLIGPIAAAMTTCRLLRLDRGRTATAIGIATCSSGGLRRNMGTMAKALHSGQAARAGIEAAMLAQRGFTADPAIIESPLGFLQALVLPEDRDLAAVTERLGRPYVLEGPLRIKRFPACSPGHPLIDAALRLVAEHAIRVDDIESIAADLHTFSLLRAEPWDEESAGFSGAFLIAATLVHKCFTLDQLTDDTAHDPYVKALMTRIRHTPAGAQETIAVSLRDGRIVTIDVRPVSRLAVRDDIRAKFRQCAGLVLARPALESLEAMILTLDRQPDMVSLMAAACRATADVVPT
jgi:2-methylcitrate dehydratase PrpD